MLKFSKEEIRQLKEVDRERVLLRKEEIRQLEEEERSNPTEESPWPNKVELLQCEPWYDEQGNPYWELWELYEVKKESEEMIERFSRETQSAIRERVKNRLSGKS